MHIKGTAIIMINLLKKCFASSPNHPFFAQKYPVAVSKRISVTDSMEFKNDSSILATFTAYDCINIDTHTNNSRPLKAKVKTDFVHFILKEGLYIVHFDVKSV